MTWRSTYTKAYKSTSSRSRDKRREISHALNVCGIYNFNNTTFGMYVNFIVLVTPPIQNDFAIRTDILMKKIWIDGSTTTSSIKCCHFTRNVAHTIRQKKKKKHARGFLSNQRHLAQSSMLFFVNVPVKKVFSIQTNPSLILLLGLDNLEIKDNILL